MGYLVKGSCVEGPTAVGTSKLLQGVDIDIQVKKYPSVE
jgi:hypothetical protein